MCSKALSWLDREGSFSMSRFYKKGLKEKFAGWAKLDDAAAALRHRARPLAAIFLCCAAGVTFVEVSVFQLYQILKSKTWFLNDKSLIFGPI